MNKEDLNKTEDGAKKGEKKRELGKGSGEEIAGNERRVSGK